jgi:DNA-binding MarR family transcriptional regulator
MLTISPGEEARLTAAKGSMVGRGFALWRDAMRWQRNVDASLAPLRLTHSQYLVLSTAETVTTEARDAVTQRAIAEGAGLDEVTTSRLVRVLCEKGWLDRGPTAGDQRAYRVIITPKGRQVLRRAAADVEAASRRFFAEQRLQDERG